LPPRHNEQCLSPRSMERKEVKRHASRRPALVATPVERYLPLIIYGLWILFFLRRFSCKARVGVPSRQRAMPFTQRQSDDSSSDDPQSQKSDEHRQLSCPQFQPRFRMLQPSLPSILCRATGLRASPFVRDVLRGYFIKRRFTTSRSMLSIDQARVLQY